MYKATKILSLPIRDIKEGKHCGQVRNILFGEKEGQYYLELDKKCLGEAEIIAKEDIAGIGENFILIKKQSDIQKVLSADEMLRSNLRKSYVLLGVEVVDEIGWHLGEIIDINIDEEGIISSIVLDGGVTIEKGEIISVCSDVVFVKEEKELKERIEKIDGKMKIIKEDIGTSNSPDDNVPGLKEENVQSPVGLKVSEDVVSADGLFELKKGSVITQEIFDKAKKHNAVLALGFTAE